MVADKMVRPIFASSDRDRDLGIFNLDADTGPEESDVTFDPELGRVDYWACIKCKNQNSNSMYRFCDKCYQVTFYLFITNYASSKTIFRI